KKIAAVPAIASQCTSSSPRGRSGFVIGRHGTSTVHSTSPTTAHAPTTAWTMTKSARSGDGVRDRAGTSNPVDAAEDRRDRGRVSSPRAPKAFAEHAEPRIRLPRGFLAALATASVDVDRVTLEAGIAREQLASREPLVTGPQLARLYAELFQPPADPDLGLRLGASVRPELFGVVGLAALSAATYGAALERCARYKRMITDMRVEVTST